MDGIIRNRLEQWLVQNWYSLRAPVWLIPLSWLYRAISTLRKLAWKSGLFKPVRLDVPVIVVGNISVGGTGKTPMVIALARRLQDAGLRVGIVSGAYRATNNKQPQPVYRNSDPAVVGDESVLLAIKTNAPVFACRNRVLAGQALLDAYAVDVLICDDGLQHYALHREIEIAVVDTERLYGNGHCLPAGPLREPVSRLDNIDLVISHGESINEYQMNLQPVQIRRLDNMGESAFLSDFYDKNVHAVAGIGHPGGFFSMLRKAGLKVEEHPFTDHFSFSSEALEFNDDRPVLMTAKDAVKCSYFAQPNWWSVEVEAVFSSALEARLLEMATELKFRESING